jgi:hypothetical protein
MYPIVINLLCLKTTAPNLKTVKHFANIFAIILGDYNIDPVKQLMCKSTLF